MYMFTYTLQIAMDEIHGGGNVPAGEQVGSTSCVYTSVYVPTCKYMHVHVGSSHSIMAPLHLLPQ